MIRRLGAMLIVFAALAACSGGGSKAATPPDTFVAQANALCAALAKDDTAGRAALGPTPTDEALTTYIRGSFVPEAVGTYQQIGGLPVSADQADHIQTLVTDVIAELKLIQAAPLTGGSKPHERELRHSLADLGLTECGAGFAPDLDKAEFIKEAGTICVRVVTDIGEQRRSRGITDASTPEAKAAFVTEGVVPIARNGLEDLRTIGLPAGDEKTIGPILDDLGAEVNDIAADPTKFGLVDERHQRIQAAWRAYGVEACALYTE